MSDVLVPSPNNGFAMPFFYGAIRSCWAWFAVDKAVADELLQSGTGGATGMEATEFAHGKSSHGKSSHGKGTTALACLNFMHYPSMGSSYGSFTTELEVNVVGHPKKKAKSVPSLSVREFLYGQEQTKLVGYYRLHVVADSVIAIQAGRSVFGEYKYYGQFTYEIPTYNLPLEPMPPQAASSSKTMLDWTFSSHIDGGSVFADVATVGANFTLTLLLSKMQPDVQSSQTALTDYSMWSKFTAAQVDPTKTPVPPVGKRLNGSRRNYLGALTTYWIDGAASKNVKLAYGKNTNDLGLTRDMKKLLGAAPQPVAAAWIRSQPAVIESPAYFADRI